MHRRNMLPLGSVVLWGCVPMNDSTQHRFVVGLSVLCDTEEAALRAVEVLTRPLLGLAIDNLHGSLSVTPVTEEDAT